MTELYKTEKFKFNPYVGDPTQWDYFLHQYIIYEVDSLRISRIEKPEEFDYEHNYYKLLNFPKFKADNQIEVRKKLMAHFLNNNDIFKSNLILKNDELERNYLTIYQVLEYLKNYNGILIDLDTIPGGDNYHLLETPIIQKYILGGFKVTK
ncbi:hypothetical protein BY996DRAFT_7197237 [Phakopsora pachyrhizi]|nr:hypothetical protein BY996DRAFT_7197237 [Phakopsora pachyrhizi]